MSLHVRYILLVLLISALNASLAMAAAVTVTASGGGVFVVQGDNMQGMSGIDLTIEYDKSLLSSPVVKWGPVALEADMHIANTSTVPGSIMVGIIKAGPFAQNSGPIATITFGAQNSNCGITSVKAKVLDNSHQYVPVQAGVAPEAVCARAADPAFITTPGIPFSSPTTTAVPTPVAVTTSATSSQVATGLGTVTMPGESQARKEEKPAESRAVSIPEAIETTDTATQSAQPSAPEKKAEEAEPPVIKQMVHGSVLDRFKNYQGEKTPDILIALFAKDISPSIHQIPPVIVSDGKATVLVSVDQSAIKGSSTNFAMSGARLVNLKKEDGSGRWLLEIQPNSAVLSASVTILNSSSMIDFPLTVVPPIGLVTGSKADFGVFLKDAGTQTPKFDLNGDGRHDYLDDYIYTGHYLIRSKAAAR